MFDDPAVYKTEVIKGTNTGDFKFTRQFTYLVTPKVIFYYKALNFNFKP